MSTSPASARTTIRCDPAGRRRRVWCGRGAASPTARTTDPLSTSRPSAARGRSGRSTRPDGRAARRREVRLPPFLASPLPGTPDRGMDPPPATPRYAAVRCRPRRPSTSSTSGCCATGARAPVRSPPGRRGGSTTVARDAVDAAVRDVAAGRAAGGRRRSPARLGVGQVRRCPPTDGCCSASPRLLPALRRADRARAARRGAAIAAVQLPRPPTDPEG